MANSSGRPILTGAVSKDGLYAVPTQKLTVEDEVEAAKRRMRTARIADYADTHCGLPQTFDGTGAYLCGGTKDGRSPRCNMFVDTGNACLIRIGETIQKPFNSSCGKWEIRNDGDPEGDSCPKGRFEDAEISFGTTPNDLGFSCARCEYGEEMMPVADSEGRKRFCRLFNHAVEDNSCCARNEPIPVYKRRKHWSESLIGK